MLTSSMLLNDLYQFTMAYGFWKSGLAERQAVFHGHFRAAPFGGEYAVLAGTTPLWQWLQDFRFETKDIDFLSGLKEAKGHVLLPEPFLRYLQDLRLSLTISAPKEGSLIFAHEPWLRVEGPLLQCQLLETPILNMVNFQTLIATKAARICQAAEQKPVVELGLRRAHGPNGGISASRAAYIGGCHSTSNVLASQYYDIPAIGTQAHSWVMSFDNESTAFDAFADAFPHACALIVDTFNTEQGIDHAIATGQRLRQKQGSLLGVRLDSGDLTYLSQLARAKLDQAGFEDTKIFASNDLDEHIIDNLQAQQAAIDVFGVGTKLVTAFDQPALGGVYKLGALQDAQGQWQYKLKLSEQIIKISTPGRLNVARYLQDGMAICDAIYDDDLGLQPNSWLIDPTDATRRRKVPQLAHCESLLHVFLRDGRLVEPLPDIHTIRSQVQQHLNSIHASVKRLLNPHRYAVGLEEHLHEYKMKLVLALRRANH